MYKVTVVTNKQEYILMNQYVKLINPNIEFHAGNTPDYFRFKISVDHPYYDKIVPLISVFYVYDDGKEIFKGRAINSEEDFNKTHEIVCESDLGYLLDSVMRPYDFQGDIIDFFKKVISEHNKQVEKAKRFTVGKVTVVDTNNYIHRSSTEYSNCLDCLRDKLVKTHGGYIRTRYENGKRYIDYVYSAGDSNEQEIRFGENLAEFERKKDATSIFTVLIPIGAKVYTTDSEGNDVEEVINIKSVNNGLDYIEDTNAIAQYGRIVKTMEWEDVTLPANLLLKAQAYLTKCLYFDDTINLSAVDLALIDSSVTNFRVGCYTKIVSEPHGLDTYYMLESMTIYLQEPSKNTITLGTETQTLSSYTKKTSNDFTEYVEKVATQNSIDINKKIDNANKLITGGLGGYVIINRNDSGKPEEILIMNTESKDTATNVIRMNKNGIGFSTTGYDGPYTNAWTIDGNLVADFITAGTMLADRIRGGTFEVGGKGLGKDGEILVKNSKDKLLIKLDKNGMTLDKSVSIKWDNISGADDEVQGIVDNSLSDYDNSSAVDGKISGAINGDTNKNLITQITENTIQTTNILANNLRVNMANVDGTLSANKISGGTISGVVFRSEDTGKTSRIVLSEALMRVQKNISTTSKASYETWLKLGVSTIDSNIDGCLFQASGGAKHISFAAGGSVKMLVNNGYAPDDYNDSVYVFGNLQERGHINIVSNDKNDTKGIYFVVGGPPSQVGKGAQQVNLKPFAWNSSTNKVDGLYVSQDFLVTNDLQVGKDVYCVNCYESSDINLKTDIEYLKGNLRAKDIVDVLIDNVDSCSFIFNNDDEQKTNYGFIAQDIESALNNAKINNTSILCENHDGYLNLNYTQMIPILWEEVKRLKARIEELEKGA